MVTLSDVRDHLEGCHDYGHYLSALCPFHQDNKPSLMVYEDRFYCLACGKGGSLEYLLSKISTGYFIAPRQIVTPNWARWLSDCDLRTFSKQAHSYLKRHPECQLYLKKRCVNSMIDEMRLGFIEGYYTFPIFNENGTVVNMIVRAGETLQELTDTRYFSCPYQYSQSRDTIYSCSFELLEQSPFVIVVFGIIDLLSLGTMNIPSVTFSNGKVIPPSLFDQWRKLFYVIGDKNEEKEAKRLAASLGWRGRFVSLDYPQGCKDVNDILMKYGKDKVIQLVNDVTRQSITNFCVEAI